MPISVGQHQSLRSIAVSLVILLSVQDDWILNARIKVMGMKKLVQHLAATNSASVPKHLLQNYSLDFQDISSSGFKCLLILEIDLYSDSQRTICNWLVSVEGSGHSKVIPVYHGTKHKFWYVEIVNKTCLSSSLFSSISPRDSFHLLIYNIQITQSCHQFSWPNTSLM